MLTFWLVSYLSVSFPHASSILIIATNVHFWLIHSSTGAA